MASPHELALTLLLAAPASSQDAPALFSENCARCHGETGDGQGTTELDRPARSFKDGGFSYGNTPEALFRTISIGIPGTPMPAFDSSLTEAELRALADHVISLGPEVREVTTEETVLVVRDRPLVVRGMLPPITEGAVSYPRGLLLGTTAGLTFEYRADDVRLLGVRQGGFVERSDWTGRGGTELRPLGQVVIALEGGKPQATFLLGVGRDPTHADAADLLAELEGTWIRGERVGLRYRLIATDGGHVATVEEEVRAVATSVASGFARRFVLEGGPAASRVWLRAYSGLTRSIDGFPTSSEQGSDTIHWSVRQPLRANAEWTPESGQGPFECVGLRGLQREDWQMHSPRLVGLELAPRGRAEIETFLLLAPEWEPELRAGLLELFR